MGSCRCLRYHVVDLEIRVSPGATWGQDKVGSEPELTPKGQELLAAVKEGRTSDALWDALAVEAVRMTERLDEMDRLIRHRGGVLHLLQAKREDLGLGTSAKVVVTIDHVVMEARETAGQLRMVAQALKLGQSTMKPQGESQLGNLRARRQRGA